MPWPFPKPPWTFQSAPLTDVRGDAANIVNRGRTSGFQSAPLTDVRGDSYPTKDRSGIAWFQSAPLTDVRGDYAFLGARDLDSSVSIRSPH